MNFKCETHPIDDWYPLFDVKLEKQESGNLFGLLNQQLKDNHDVKDSLINFRKKIYIFSILKAKVQIYHLSNAWMTCVETHIKL